MSIALHIERLVVDEAVLAGERAGSVRAALEVELGRLLAQPGASAALRGLGAIAALPPAALPPAGHPHERLGPRIATAVQHSLGIPPAARGAGKEH
ncbi:hypothetical protein [Rhodanobacter lindaniclasticus]|uniref:Uncharacterized protein n=1 Tax=Rhodanobacter lindaniclasticus TaxID=75310 RepID=A0A4S3KED0_9GAMM|nr:hypothetical protein [Rhodanobacter lindaniclasticus]THD06284.1 hypothetical protein B1991_13790 [Rhodanobacter lindaniclasticus]